MFSCDKLCSLPDGQQDSTFLFRLPADHLASSLTAMFMPFTGPKVIRNEPSSRQLSRVFVFWP